MFPAGPDKKGEFKEFGLRKACAAGAAVRIQAAVRCDRFAKRYCINTAWQTHRSGFEKGYRLIQFV